MAQPVLSFGTLNPKLGPGPRLHESSSRRSASMVHPSSDDREQEEHEEQKEQHLCESRSASRHASEAEDCRQDGDPEKNHRPTQHRKPPWPARARSVERWYLRCHPAEVTRGEACPLQRKNSYRQAPKSEPWG